MTLRDDPAHAATQADILWVLPTHGDGSYLGSGIGARHVTLAYLGQIARAADALGYYRVLLPTGKSCEDSWVVAAAMAPLTERLRFLVAVRPGVSEPSMTARMAASLDRLSGGRLLVNVVAGGDPAEREGDGVFLNHAERYQATDEYLTVWRRLPIEERRRLLRHLRPFWDAHRFQSAPQIDRAIGDARRSGRLELLAAATLTRETGWIVNYTGPGHRSVVERHPVLQALRDAGALQADPLSLGISVDPSSRVIRPGGDAWSTLFVVGPLARGTHGELTGLPQVSAQPREVAALIAALLPRETTMMRDAV